MLVKGQEWNGQIVVRSSELRFTYSYRLYYVGLGEFFFELWGQSRYISGVIALKIKLRSSGLPHCSSLQPYL